MFRRSLLALALALACVASAEPVRQRYDGIPHYRIFTDRDTQNTSRANFIACAPNGDFYFGSENGLLVYDGSGWRNLMRSGSTLSKIRSLRWIDGTLYATGYGSVGRIVVDPAKGADYEPINDEPLPVRESEFFYEIVPNGRWVHFVGTQTIVTYDRETDTLAVESSDAWNRASFLLDGVFHICADTHGAMRYSDGKYELAEAFSEFRQTDAITRVATSPQGSIAFVTARGELYRVVDGKPTRAFPAFERPRGYVTDIAFLDERRLAVAVAGVGISIIDPEGRALTQLDRDIDYRWSATRQLLVDDAGSLWAMFNTSVGKVLASSAVTQIDERLRPNLYYGRVYEAQGNLYLQTNGQLFHARCGEEGRLTGFELVPGDDLPSIQAMCVLGEDLLAQREETTYRFAEGRFIPLGSPGRADHLAPSALDPRQILYVSQNDLKLCRLDGDRIEVLASLPHDLGYIYRVEADKAGRFWLELGLGRVGKVAFADGKLSLRIYDASDGLGHDWMCVWDNGGEIYFPERTGVFAYDAQTDRFALCDVLDRYLPNGGEIFHRVATDRQGNIWASYGARNYILWKQPDGSYLKDSHSLAPMGELFLFGVLTLDDRQSLIVTATELFHLDPTQATRGDHVVSPSRVTEVTNLKTNRIHYLDTGFDRATQQIRLGPDERSLFVRVANSDSTTLRPPKFQYLLEGTSDVWSKWSTSNEIHLTNLDPGRYRLRIRTQLDNGIEPPETALAVAVEPTAFQTPTAYAFYALLAALVVWLGYRFFARNLKAANVTLESMVAARTQEIEGKNLELEKQAETLERKNLELADQSEQLQSNAADLGAALEELRAAQDQIMATSRKAGMAEVATNVLHNVGNVLNSINVSATQISQRLSSEHVARLEHLSRLIESRRDSLAEFIANDPRGKSVPDYISHLAVALAREQSQISDEFVCLQENIEHVKRIIAMQQAHAKTVDVRQEIQIASLIDNAVNMIFSDLERSLFEIERDCPPDLAVESDKHSILQMLTNVIKNAKEAIKEARREPGRIEIRAEQDPESEYVILSVTDNGIGIDREHLSRIFTHGFTTKQEGHGFGMHSCANAARALGGDIQVESDGLGHGATVRLRLPIKAPLAIPR